MAKQTFTTGQVLTAAQVNSLQANDFNQTVSVKTADYTLVAADKGTRIEFNTSGSVTCTVNTGLFDAGDTVIIQNRGSGTVTVTAGTATVNTNASLAVAQYGYGTLYFISASASIFFADAGGIPASAFTAKGDILVGTGSGTYDKLGVGADGTNIVADSSTSTGLQWKVRPDFIGCAVYTINAVVAFTSATAKVINYGSEDYDTNSFHDNSTNNSRITIPTGLGGKYNISALIRTEDAVGNLYCILGLLKNGSDFNSLGIPASVVKSDDQGTVAIVYTVQVSLAAGDYVEFSFNSNWATGNKTITSRFCVEYLGA